MKKIIVLVLAFAMILASLAFVGCDNGTSNNNDTTAENTTAGTNNETTESALKLGLGIVSTVSASDATEDVNGKNNATFTAAAVLVDENGKIVKAFIDCADNKVEFTIDGKAIAATSFATKYELGTNYGMTNPNYGGTATKEWFEQADIFCNLIVGKTATEVLALVAADAKGTEDVINAGCTIYVSDFAKAVEKAINNAVACNASANDTVKIGAATTQTTTDATDEKAGSNKIATTFFAAAVDANGKVTASSTDCVEVTFGFDNTGKSTFDATKAVSTKKEQGANYGMTNPNYGGTATKEWFEQAAAFDSCCTGKTASEIQGLMGNDGKGNADVQAAGCTIYVTDFVKAAAKIG